MTIAYREVELAPVRRVPATAYDDWLHFQLQLTYRCQLDCIYCGLDRSKPDMSEEMVARGLEFCFGTAAQNVEIQLFGGEPLMRFDLMRFATERAEALAAERGKRLVLGLATNGLLLDEARAAFIADHGLDVVISIDGHSAVHARNRPLRASRAAASDAPYPIERVIAGFRRLVRAGVEPMVNMVVGPDDVSELAEGVGYLVDELGATLVRVAHRLGVAWSEADRAAFFAALEGAIDRYGDRARFVNLCSPDEPTLAATSVNLDGDGRIYLGCALTTTEDMPSLLDTNFVGDIASLPGVDAVDRDRENQRRNLVSSPWLRDHDRELIRNNLEMGLEAVAFSRAYIDRHRERLDLDALGCGALGDFAAEAEGHVGPASAEEILACLPEPPPARLAEARAEATPGALAYDFGRDAAEIALIARAAPAAVVAGDPERIAARYARRGLHVVPIPGAEGRAAVARDPGRARALAEVEAAGTADLQAQLRRAELIGAPSCCVAASRERHDHPTLLARARDALARTGTRPSPLLNVLDPAVFQLVPWVPCALDCAASARRAGRLLAALERVSRVFARRALGELSAHRLVLHDRVQASIVGVWNGERLLVERAWPTSRHRHPEAPAPVDELEAMARLAALLNDGREVRFDGELVLVRGAPLGGVVGTLFPFGEPG